MLLRPNIYTGLELRWYYEIYINESKNNSNHHWITENHRIIMMNHRKKITGKAREIYRGKQNTVTIKKTGKVWHPLMPVIPRNFYGIFFTVYIRRGRWRLRGDQNNSGSRKREDLRKGWVNKEVTHMLAGDSWWLVWRPITSHTPAVWWQCLAPLIYPAQLVLTWEWTSI